MNRSTIRRKASVLNVDGRPWYTIDNAAGDRTAKVYLYDAIGASYFYEGVTAGSLTRELDALEDVDTIELHINCPGGNVFDGIAIRNALDQHPARVVAVVDGLAASAASFIACAGDEVVMAPHSEMMIHDASGACLGNASDMAFMAERLTAVSDNIASMYAERAGGTAKKWRDRMLAETWYSADEAVKAGLADRVGKPAEGRALEEDEVENTWDLSAFAYAGRSHAPDPDLPAASAAGAHPPAAAASGDTTQEGAAMDITDQQLTTLRQTAGVADDADIDTITAAITEALQEQADPPAETSASQIPEGAVLVDQTALDELRAQAQAGAEARAQQAAEHREHVLDDAVRTGRIAPAARASWAALLERDPSNEAVITDLSPNTVPVAEVGHAGGTTEKADDDDAFYSNIFPKEA